MQMMIMRGCSNQAITVLCREENKKGRVKEEGEKKKRRCKSHTTRPALWFSSCDHPFVLTFDCIRHLQICRLNNFLSTAFSKPSALVLGPFCSAGLRDSVSSPFYPHPHVFFTTIVRFLHEIFFSSLKVCIRR